MWGKRYNKLIRQNNFSWQIAPSVTDRKKCDTSRHQAWMRREKCATHQINNIRHICSLFILTSARLLVDYRIGPSVALLLPPFNPPQWDTHTLPLCANNLFCFCSTQTHTHSVSPFSFVHSTALIRMCAVIQSAGFLLLLEWIAQFFSMKILKVQDLIWFVFFSFQFAFKKMVFCDFSSSYFPHNLRKKWKKSFEILCTKTQIHTAWRIHAVCVQLEICWKNCSRIFNLNWKANSARS